MKKMRDYLVYCIPTSTHGRNIPITAANLDDAQTAVEEMLPPPPYRGMTWVLSWKTSGTGRMLTIRGQRGRVFGHYWVRPTPDSPDTEQDQDQD